MLPLPVEDRLFYLPDGYFFELGVVSISMSVLGTIASAAVRFVTWSFRKLSNEVSKPSFEVIHTRSLTDRTPNGTIRTKYRVLIENIGNETAHDCRAVILFQGGNRHHGQVEWELTVDTPVPWDRNGGIGSISLHADEREWVDIFRLVQGGRPPSRGSPAEYIEFPTASGWNRPADVEFQHLNSDAALNEDESIPVESVRGIYWETTQLAIRSEETTREITLNMDDMNSKMDGTPLFSATSFSSDSSPERD